MGEIAKAQTQLQTQSLKTLVSSESIKKRFNEILGKKSAAFVSSLISVSNNNELLTKADPTTVVTAGIMAATLDLPINQNLGFAYIVPFYNGKKKIYEAQFQMGYKGYIQLAIRAGKYKKINAIKIYEGEYMAYFRLENGYEQYLYMTKEEMEAHAKKYSQTYKKGFGLWKTDFDAMAIKTVLKQLLSKYGILSVEMQNMANALTSDGAVIRDNDGELTPDFEGETIDIQSDVAETIANNANSETIDIEPSPTNEFVDPETGEVVRMFGD